MFAGRKSTRRRTSASASTSFSKAGFSARGSVNVSVSGNIFTRLDSSGIAGEFRLRVDLGGNVEVRTPEIWPFPVYTRNEYVSGHGWVQARERGSDLYVYGNVDVLAFGMTVNLDFEHEF